MRALRLWVFALMASMVVSVSLMAVAQPKPDKVIVLEGQCPVEDAYKGAHRMHLLPFDVPEGVTRIEIKKELDYGPNGRGTVDHGLADPCGAGFGMPGFRGWMGGSRADITLTGDPASN